MTERLACSVRQNRSKFSKFLTGWVSDSDNERVPRDSTWLSRTYFGNRMNSTPHYVLFSRTREQSSTESPQGSSWYFRLEASTGESFEACDTEVGLSKERLELLATVRGLEALDQPSSVTLVTSSRQISRAVRQGLEYWRVRNWMWERFGEKVPMKNGDLWARIDRALQIHDVRCRTFRIDRPHAEHGGRWNDLAAVDPGRRRGMGSRELDDRSRLHARDGNRGHGSRRFRPVATMARWAATSMRNVADGLQRLASENSPKPHPMM